MRENNIKKKSKAFALRIIRLYQYLQETHKEFVMSKQLLRCGTSIGANIYEAENAQSKADFYAKIYISFKEANETSYWIELLHESNYIPDNAFESIHNDNIEILKILSSITKNTPKK